PELGPDTSDEVRVFVPDFRGLQLVEALDAARSAGLEIEVHDWGVVRHQWPAPGAGVLQQSVVDLYFRPPYLSSISGLEPAGGNDGL
ncbi:MAG: PASTA domain-containing protein, partial [Myxococcales bacterium]|nr:PASTA domain-containing protein [Myxococcales bacterium]